MLLLKRLFFLSVWSSGRVMTTFHREATCRPVVIGARGMTRTDLTSIISILENSGRIRHGSSMLVINPKDGQPVPSSTTDKEMTPFESGVIMQMTGSTDTEDYTSSRRMWTMRVADALSTKDHPDVVVVPFYVLYHEWLPMRAPPDITRNIDMIAPSGEGMPITPSSYLIFEDHAPDRVV